jgi:hypothetical protein
MFYIAYQFYNVGQFFVLWHFVPEFFPIRFYNKYVSSIFRLWFNLKHIRCRGRGNEIHLCNQQSIAYAQIKLNYKIKHKSVNYHVYYVLCSVLLCLIFEVYFIGSHRH